VVREARGSHDTTHDRRREGLIALALYLAAAFLLFGLKLAPHMGSSSYGENTADPKTYIWFIEWWPHALWTLSNPLSPDVVAGPHHYNVVWAGASIPGPSTVMAPVTSLFGPLVGFNLWILLALPLSAWASYLLCRAVGADRWPSVLGGFLFGFSSFAMHHTLHGHLNFTIALGIPLAASLVARHLAGDLSSRRFVLLLAAVLVWEFLVSTEVFFTMTVFGSLALIALVAIRWTERRALLEPVRRIGLSYLVALGAMTPFLVAAFADPPARRFLLSPDRLSAAPATFFLPSEQQSHIGLGIFAVVILYTLSRWRRPATWALTGGFALILVLVMGPTLKIGDARLRWPWAGLWRLPFFRYVIPARLIAFAFLLGGIMVALWISAGRRSRILRWGLGALSAASIVIPFLPVGPGPPDPRVAFFSDGAYRRHIAPGDTVVCLPFDRNVAMLWQAEAGMGFRLVYPFFGVSLIAPYERTSPVWEDLRSLHVLRGSSPALVRYLRVERVREVLVTGELSGGWLAVLEQMHAAPPVHDQGLTIYHIPVADLPAATTGVLPLRR
jgi:hypothetical protein